MQERLINAQFAVSENVVGKYLIAFINTSMYARKDSNPQPSDPKSNIFRSLKDVQTIFQDKCTTICTTKNEICENRS